MVQWLRSALSMKGVRVRFLAGEPRSHMPKKKNQLRLGNSLVVQWLASTAGGMGAQVQSLVGGPRSRMPHGAAKKKKKNNHTKPGHFHIDITSQAERSPCFP